jgi:hypothetical protein
MKHISAILAAVLVIGAAAATISSEAQDAADQNGAAERSAPVAGDDAAAPDAAEPDADAQRAPASNVDDEFVPTEEINADEEVTFPVDI